MSGRRIVVGLVFAVIAFATACQPTFVIPSPPTPCYVGSFTLKAEQFTAPLSTPIGSVTVSLLPGGDVTLTTTSAGAWSLSGTETVAVSGAFAGQATVQGAGSGTYTATASSLHFTVGSVSGSATVDGTLNGQPVHLVLTIPGSWIDKAIGLQGDAGYACANNGLSLTFTSLHLDF